MGWSRDEILSATRGRLVREGKKKSFGEIVTDSSKVKKGSVFVALRGEKLDGHRFVGDAVRRGAYCVVVRRASRGSTSEGVTVIRVPDTLRALGDLAHYRRELFAPKVLAITGSNGKTTTKEMVASILEEASVGGQSLRGKVLKTAGNLNNQVGLPLTLLRLRKSDAVAVVELGTNRPGEIQSLAEIADPDMGIITSVAPAHLDGLDSLAGIAREKGALYRNVRPSGTIAVNLDDPWVRRLGAKFKGRKITYGARGRVRAEFWRPLGVKGIQIRLRAGKQRCNVRLNFLGHHNIANAVGAAALAFGFGVNLSTIRRGLEKARPYSMRMQIDVWQGIGVINDAYNANPASMEAAVRTLKEIACQGERVAVLGDMFELGKRSQQEHLKLGRRVAEVGLDRLYLLGAQATHVRTGALEGGMQPERIIIGQDHSDIARQLRTHIKKGDWLLIKGSRGMKMEKVVLELKG
jgi:UDP-N-acetylmuramoyl-tripeptide--D-alanyl-D-alanine ligase